MLLGVKLTTLKNFYYNSKLLSKVLLKQFFFKVPINMYTYNIYSVLSE